MDSARKRTFSNAMELSPTHSFVRNSAHNISTSSASNYQIRRIWGAIEDDYPFLGKRNFSGSRSDIDFDESMCFICSKSINDEFVYKTAPNMKLHRRCLRCDECGRLLDEDYSCFVQSSKIYCKSDYTRLFTGKCVKCKHSFAADDSIIRINSRACHAECFSCDLCMESIGFGDEFIWTGDKLLCKKDWQNQEIDRKPTSIKSETKSTIESETKTDNELPNPPKKPKTTRVRTVLNEKQLQTLRTCYNNNPRPDALMKEQLCEMTGLTPRVIRVWFQNKRCKDKKRSLMIKQLQEQERLREMGRTALPMIATSPITNDLTGHIGPVDITSYRHHHWRPLHSQQNIYGQSSLGNPQDMGLISHQRQFDHFYNANGTTNQPSSSNVDLIQQSNYGIYPNGDRCYDDHDSHLH